MTERERWIVYPLLFLALGAALRDKVIKTTQSQRIKCQGLYVVDKDEKPILILGAEQFPELRVDAPDFLRVDRVESANINGGRLLAKDVIAASELQAGRVVGTKYAITDGQRVLQLDGRYTGQLIGLVQMFLSRIQALQFMQPALQSPAVSKEGDEQQARPSPPLEKSSEPAQEPIPEAAPPGEPGPD